MTHDRPHPAARDAAAVAHHRAGRLEEAARAYAEILKREPGNAQAAHNLGVAQLGLGHAQAAEASFARTLAISPDHLDALVNRGTALKAMGRLEAAEACYRDAIARDPRNRTAIRNLGILLNLAERHTQSLAAADEALALQRHPEGLTMRGDALYGLGRFAEALESYSQAASLAPDPYEALTKQAIAHTGLRQYGEALALLDRAVALRPADHLARYRRAFVRLLTGDFKGGWRDFELRWRDETFVATSSAAVSAQVRQSLDLNLEPDDLKGRRVLLVAEWGVGDQVMLASMIPDLAALAASVTCVCEPRLVRLFANSLEGVTFVDQAQARLARSAFDKVVAMGSLGGAFRNRAADFPGRAFLRPREAVAAAWADRLGPAPKGLRIGVSWRGGTPATRAGLRSLELRRLAPILGLPDSEIVSLQYGETASEIAAARAELGCEIRAFPKDQIDDFEDLAGLIANLDIVV